MNWLLRQLLYQSSTDTRISVRIAHLSYDSTEIGLGTAFFTLLPFLFIFNAHLQYAD